jgi:catechol 2,3-dioxygenase-like lactoylglutathione lyase family enzyme
MKNENQSENGIKSFSLYNIAFTVTNLDASLKWYSDVFGFNLVSRSSFQLPTGTAEAAIIEANGLKLELLYVPHGKRIEEMFAELPFHLIPIGNKAVVLQVTDIALASEELASKGVKFVYREQNLVEGAMLSTMIEDIDGNKINIFQTNTLIENIK